MSSITDTSYSSAPVSNFHYDRVDKATQWFNKIVVEVAITGLQAIIYTVFMRICHVDLVENEMIICVSLGLITWCSFNLRNRYIRYTLCNIFSYLYHKTEIDREALLIANQSLSTPLGTSYFLSKHESKDTAIRSLSFYSVAFREGVCDGKTLSFLHLINNSDAATWSDSQIESNLPLLGAYKHQLESNFFHSVLYHSYRFNTKRSIKSYKQNNHPYNCFKSLRVFKEARLINIEIEAIIDGIYKVALSYENNQDEVLVGSIQVFGGQKVGHVFCAQFNLGKYRFRDIGGIESFSSIRQLVQGILEQIIYYYSDYKYVQVELWKLPYKKVT